MVAQSVADSALDVPTKDLELLTASIKRGIKFTGPINLEDQMSHDLRVTALTNIGRGWPTMTKGVLAAQFKWYLHDYADTSLNRDTTIPKDCWGGSALLGFAATFLQRDIYVLN